MQIIPLIPVSIESDNFSGIALVDLTNSQVYPLNSNTVLTEETRNEILLKFKNSIPTQNTRVTNSLNDIQNKFQNYYNNFKNIRDKYVKPN